MLDRLTSYTDPEGYTFSHHYDANGNMAGMVDGRGNAKAVVYDGLNRAVKTYDELKNFSTVEYDADGRMVKAVNAEGAETYYEYDKNDNVILIKDALGNKTHITYDNMNRVDTVTDALGAVTRYSYTAADKVETAIDALDGVKRYEYNLRGNLIKETNELGHSTVYAYDALSRPLTVTNSLGDKDSFEYDANSRIIAVTDKNGNKTRYLYDANGNIIETVDAKNHSSYFEYDEMNRLVNVSLYRANDRQKVNEKQVTLYKYDKRGLLTHEINAAEDETIFVYDGNGNLVQKKDADGYVTEYSFDVRNLVDSINYADGKEARFAYNKNGELVKMTDWNGTVNISLDILDRIISVNDHNGKITSYAYDAVGNQTGITYPDGTEVDYSYDLLRRLTNLKDAEKQDTKYRYDAASQLIQMNYPNGWEENYIYDPVGQLLSQIANDPSDKVNKQVLHTFVYDPQGNIVRETRTGAVGQDKYDYTHTYDELNRLTGTRGQLGQKNQNHDFIYDSLGNLIFEKNDSGAKKGNEYWYNNLNQQIKKVVDEKDLYSFTFDKRGNLTKDVYNKKAGDPSKDEVRKQYVYDATNRMAKGTNELGEQSHYIYNGLGYLVGNEWIIEKNAYGYHGIGINLDPSVQVNGVVVCDRHENTTGQGHINPTGKGHTTGGTTGGALPKIDNKKFAVVHKDYVLDYTSPLQNVIMEYESGDNALAYRYVYGLNKVETVIYGIPNGVGSVMQPAFDGSKGDVVKLYYHQDRLGSTDYLTDNITGKNVSYVTYDDWGKPTAKGIIKMGVRELDLVTEYTGHPYDQVLDLYYAKARMYDPGDRRFMAADPIKGRITSPQTLALYTYCLNNPIRFFDPTGLLTEQLLINGVMIPRSKWERHNITGRIFVELHELGRATQADSWSSRETAGWIPGAPRGINPIFAPERGQLSYNLNGTQFWFVDNGRYQYSRKFDTFSYEMSDVRISFEKKPSGQYYVSVDDLKAYIGALANYDSYHTFDSQQEFYDYTANKVLQYFPQMICLQRNVAILGLGGYLQAGARFAATVGIVVDGYGGIGVVVINSGGIGTPSVGVSAIGGLVNANVISQLRGRSFEIGVSLSKKIVPVVFSPSVSGGLEQSWAISEDQTGTFLVLAWHWAL